MNIPADKIAHMKAGAAISLFGAIASGLGAALFSKFIGMELAAVLLVSLISAGSCSIVSAVVAGVVKEYADNEDNKIHPGMHGVEWRDAAATALPGVLLAVPLLTAAYLVAR